MEFKYNQGLETLKLFEKYCESFKNKYYSLVNMLKEKPHYLMSWGTRSTGKTYNTLSYCIMDYMNTGRCMGYIRRWKHNVEGSDINELFNNHIANGDIERLTNGKWNNVYAYSRHFYLCKYDLNGKRIKTDKEAFCTAFGISAQQDYKSIPYPNIKNIVFDEFMSSDRYYKGWGEFSAYMNLLNTIIREKKDVLVIMLANTINFINPYFDNMGLDGAEFIKQGEHRIYKRKVDNKQTQIIACEFTDSFSSTLENKSVYFTFGKENLNMINAKGDGWDLDLYPLLEEDYEELEARGNVLYKYDIEFNDYKMEGSIIKNEDDFYTYIHLKNEFSEPNDIIFSNKIMQSSKYRRFITKPIDMVGKRINWFISTGNLFFQNNRVGNIFDMYLQSCLDKR